MIKLTRLDGQPFILNADLIRFVEQRPDTFVTLTSGERIVVGESMDRVVELAIEYQQRKAFVPSASHSPRSQSGLAYPGGSHTRGDSQPVSPEVKGAN
jgi:flagellar protein FlbD